MKLNVIAAASADLTQVEEMSRLPAFRKATRAMRLVYSAIASLLAAQPQVREALARDPANFGLILGSAFGELDTTVDFLRTFAEIGVARPLLFQNSLHNSTSGFASIQFRITGPVVTVSHGLFPFEHALEAANLVLSQDQGRRLSTFVVYVETFVSDLIDLKSSETSAGSDRAVAFLLNQSTDAGVATITDVTCHRRDLAQTTTYSASYFSGPTAAELLKQAIESSETGGDLRDQKTSQNYSVIQWRRPGSRA